MTKEDFIAAAQKKYGDKYDYSLVTDEGLKNQTNVPIRCSKHGLFWITPYMLLNGMVTCFECFKEEWWNKDGLK